MEKKKSMPKGSGRLFNENVPFIGSMKEHKGNYVQRVSMRRFKRGALKGNHNTMKPQIIQYFKAVGGVIRTRKNATGLKEQVIIGGTRIVTGGKVIWHDANVFSKS